MKVIFGKKLFPNKRVILFVTNPKRMLSAYDTPDLPETLMRYILESVRKVKDAHLVIKLHPYDKNYPIYKRLFKELMAEEIITVLK